MAGKLFQIVQVAIKLLEHCHEHTEQCSSVMRALAAAAQAAMAVNPATTAGIAQGLVAAEAGAAGIVNCAANVEAHPALPQAGAAVNQRSDTFFVKTCLHPLQEQSRTWQRVQCIAIFNERQRQA